MGFMHELGCATVAAPPASYRMADGGGGRGCLSVWLAARLGAGRSTWQIAVATRISTLGDDAARSDAVAGWRTTTWAVMQDNATKSTPCSTAFLSYRSSATTPHIHLHQPRIYIRALYATDRKRNDGKNALPWRWRQRATGGDKRRERELYDVVCIMLNAHCVCRMCVMKTANQ